MLLPLANSMCSCADALGRTVTAGELRIALRRFENAIHAIAQHDAKCIGSRVHHRGHIVGVIEDGLAIVAPARREFAVANLGAVDVEFVLTETRRRRAGHE